MFEKTHCKLLKFTTGFFFFFGLVFAVLKKFWWDIRFIFVCNLNHVRIPFLQIWDELKIYPVTLTSLKFSVLHHVSIYDAMVVLRYRTVPDVYGRQRLPFVEDSLRLRASEVRKESRRNPGEVKGYNGGSGPIRIVSVALTLRFHDGQYSVITLMFESKYYDSFYVITGHSALRLDELEGVYGTTS